MMPALAFTRLSAAASSGAQYEPKLAPEHRELVAVDLRALLQIVERGLSGLDIFLVGDSTPLHARLAPPRPVEVSIAMPRRANGLLSAFGNSSLNMSMPGKNSMAGTLPARFSGKCSTP